MIFFKKVFFIFCLFVLTANSIYPQQKTPSTLVSDIIKKKKQNPKMTEQKLADYANELLSTKGFNYNFEMSELFFQKTARKQFPESQKEQIIKFPFEFALVNNGKKTFEINAKHNLHNECYDESTPAFPVIQATENQATLIINNNPVAVKIPKEFSGTIVYLIDSKTKKKVLKKWASPYQSGVTEESFVGFSADGEKLYVTIEDSYILDYEERKEVKELALEISSNGKLRFVPKASVKKKFKMEFAEGNLSENIKADMVLKIKIGSKVYYLAVPDTSC